MILCDGNYGLGSYGMDSVHNRESERSSKSSHISSNVKRTTGASTKCV